MSIEKSNLTPISFLCRDNNDFYIKREDFIPFSFGGNKARKAQYFFDEIDKGDYDIVVTYGSSSSNHCRIISNMTKQRNMRCIIVSPLESSHETFNSKMMKLFGAEIISVHVDDVHNKIDEIINELKKDGRNPYFIPGGGHSNLGTKAYIDCFNEILTYGRINNVDFDYIFLASGTGTTQAGLVCGKILTNSKTKIIGISIARKLPRGKKIIIDSEKEYFSSIHYKYNESILNEETIFLDDYVGEGYACDDVAVKNTIISVMERYGIPLDETYTGKAYYGMLSFIKQHNINNSKILFIHTGGTPLYFDFLKGVRK